MKINAYFIDMFDYLALLNTAIIHHSWDDCENSRFIVLPDKNEDPLYATVIDLDNFVTSSTNNFQICLKTLSIETLCLDEEQLNQLTNSRNTEIKEGSILTELLPNAERNILEARQHFLDIVKEKELTESEKNILNLFRIYTYDFDLHQILDEKNALTDAVLLDVATLDELQFYRSA